MRVCNSASGSARRAGVRSYYYYYYYYYGGGAGDERRGGGGLGLWFVVERPVALSPRALRRRRTPCAVAPAARAFAHKNDGFFAS